MISLDKSSIESEDNRMQHANRYSPPGQSPPSPPQPPSPSSRQNKVLSQREYREREQESFNTLRDVIRILTGEELRTRYEILRKAIDLLVASSGIGDQSASLASTLAAHDAPTLVTEPENTAALDHLGHLDPAQTSHWSQPWQPNPGFHLATPGYDTHFQDDRQYPSMSTMDPTFSHFGSPGSGEDPSGYPRFGGPF